MVSHIIGRVWNFFSGTRKRRFEEDEFGLPHYDYKMPKIREEYYSARNQASSELKSSLSVPVSRFYGEASSLPDVKIPKSLRAEVNQQMRQGVSLSLFKKNVDHSSQDTDDVVVLPGPSGVTVPSRDIQRPARPPLLSVQQDEVTVIKEVKSPGSKEFRAKHSDTMTPHWIPKAIVPKHRFRYERPKIPTVQLPPTKKFGVLNKLQTGGVTKKRSPARRSILDLCYRMEEKKRYSNLLKNYILNASSSYQTLETMVNSPTVNSPRFGFSSYMSPLCRSSEQIELVDLTLPDDVLEKTSKISSPQVKITSPEVAQAKVVPITRSLSVEEVEEVIVLDRENYRKNSLAETYNKSGLLDYNWFQDITSDYHERRRQLDAEKEKTKLRARLLAEHAKDLDDKYVDRISKQIHAFDISKEEEEEEEEEEIEELLPLLSDEAESLVNRALIPRPPQEVLVSGFNKEITRKDISTLSGLNWLNDEVINFYMDLLMERGKLENYPSVYAMNTFFYPKLRQNGHGALKRWTKKVDVFSYEMIVVPVHLGMHWCMSLIDLKNKTVSYYDSMGGSDQGCPQLLLKYLQDESMDKKRTAYNTSDWQCLVPKDIPQQMNGSDCGMFSCMFAETLTRRAKINFSQENMPYFRRRMVYEILSKKLMS